MSLWPAAFRTAIDAGARIARVLEIDYPSGTERLSYAGSRAGDGAGVCTTTEGTYPGLISRYLSMSRSARGRDSSLQGGRASCTFVDASGAFRDRLGQREKIRYSAVRGYIVAEGLAKASWFQVYGGLLDSCTAEGPISWTLNFCPPDVLLRAPMARHPITDYDWPDAPSASLNLPVPIVDGRFDSEGAPVRRGQVPCIHVDTVNHVYVVCRGWQTVPRVYVGETIQTTGYAITHPVRNGWQFTCVDFTGAQTGAVTCDVQGYDSAADGTGTSIIRLVPVLRHALNEYQLRDHRSGSWNGTDDALIDTAYWDACDTDLLGRAGGADYMGCIRSAGTETGLNQIDKTLGDNDLRGWWSNLGKLRIGIVKPEDATVRTDAATYRREHDVEWDPRSSGSGSFLPAVEIANPVGTILATYGDLKQELAVTDPGAESTVSEKVSLDNGARSIP